MTDGSPGPDDRRNGIQAGPDRPRHASDAADGATDGTGARRVTEYGVRVGVVYEFRLELTNGTAITRNFDTEGHANQFVRNLNYFGSKKNGTMVLTCPTFSITVNPDQVVCLYVRPLYDVLNPVYDYLFIKHPKGVE